MRTYFVLSCFFVQAAVPRLAGCVHVGCPTLVPGKGRCPTHKTSQGRTSQQSSTERSSLLIPDVLVTGLDGPQPSGSHNHAPCHHANRDGRVTIAESCDPVTRRELAVQGVTNSDAWAERGDDPPTRDHAVGGRGRVADRRPTLRESLTSRGIRPCLPRIFPRRCFFSWD